MIKFVLHGGDAKPKNKDNIGFFSEMTDGLRGRIKILFNCFACDDEVIADKYKRNCEKFKLYSVNKNLKFALADPKKFVRQIKWADVVFIHGGSTEKLVNKLLPFISQFENLLEGKVVGGSSAGVYCLSKYYYGNVSQKIGKGSGILNIKSYCHYDPKDRLVVEKLASYKEKLPLLILTNYKWVVMYK